MTEECLLDPSRNPHLGKEGIERLLKENLGIDKVIWLWKGMAGASKWRARLPVCLPACQINRCHVKHACHTMAHDESRTLLSTYPSTVLSSRVLCSCAPHELCWPSVERVRATCMPV